MFDVNELPVYARGHYGGTSPIDAVRTTGSVTDRLVNDVVEFCDSPCKEVKQRLGWSPKVLQG